MTENEITGDILDASIKLHRQFGAVLLESVYEALLEIELRKRGHKVERQKSISFEYEGVALENAFRLDMLVDDKVIVELKSTEKMSPVFAKQLKTYLAITKLQVGVVVNFGMTTLKEGFLRFVNNFQEQPLSDSASLREDKTTPTVTSHLRDSASLRENKTTPAQTSHLSDSASLREVETKRTAQR